MAQTGENLGGLTFFFRSLSECSRLSSAIISLLEDKRVTGSRFTFQSHRFGAPRSSCASPEGHAGVQVVDPHLTLVHTVPGLFATGPAAASFAPQGGVHESVQRAAAACVSWFKVQKRQESSPPNYQQQLNELLLNRNKSNSFLSL